MTHQCIAITKLNAQCRLTIISKNKIYCHFHTKMINKGLPVYTIYDKYNHYMPRKLPHLININKYPTPSAPPMPVLDPEPEPEPLIITDTYECQCCFTEYTNEELIKCSKASTKYTHVFCKDCINGYIEANLSDRKATLCCMMSNADKCNGEYTLLDIEKSTTNDIYTKFDEMKAITDTLMFSKILDNYQICPFCYKYGIIIQNIKYIKCNRCLKIWCSRCRKEDHGDIGCNVITNNKDIDNIKKIVQETMTEALTHYCPTCKTKYIKTDGCNKIHCTSCNTYSCYLCGIKIVPIGGKYYYHFKGSGSYDGKSSCVLFNDGDGKSSDHGNAKFNNIKMIKALDYLLYINNDDVVRNVILKEIKNNGINTSLFSKYKKSSCVIS